MRKLFNNFLDGFKPSRFGGTIVLILLLNSALMTFTFAFSTQALTIIKGQELSYTILTLLLLFIYLDGFLSVMFKTAKLRITLILDPILTLLIALSYLAFSYKLIDALVFISTLSLLTLLNSVIGNIQFAKVNSLLAKRLPRTQLVVKQHTHLLWTSIAGIFSLIFGITLAHFVAELSLIYSIIRLAGFCFLAIFVYDIYVSHKIARWVVKRV